MRGQGSGVTLSLSDLIRYNDARLIDVESQNLTWFDSSSGR